MATRSYNSTVRKEAEAETLRRIVDATVQLHEEKGAMATTHADIAARAGVSVPTVYKHFPTRNALLPACMGKVGEHAPAIDPAAIMSAPDIDIRLALLVQAVHERYRYFHPWMRWTAADAPFLPELAEAAEAGRAELAMLVNMVLADIFPDRIPSTLLALTQVLLDYGTWQRLNQLLGEPEAAGRAATEALQLIVSSFTESE